MTIEERAHRYEHNDPHCEMPWCGCCPVLIDEFRAVAEERDAEVTALADALEALVRATETGRNVGMFIEDALNALRAAGRLP